MSLKALRKHTDSAASCPEEITCIVSSQWTSTNLQYIRPNSFHRAQFAIALHERANVLNVINLWLINLNIQVGAGSCKSLRSAHEQ